MYSYLKVSTTNDIYTLSLHDALPISPGLRKSRAGVPRAERARRDRGNLLMSWRRVVLAFTITFVSALVVFTLPRFVIENARDRKSTRLNSSHGYISYAVFCLKKKNTR